MSSPARGCVFAWVLLAAAIPASAGLTPLPPLPEVPSSVEAPTPPVPESPKVSRIRILGGDTLRSQHTIARKRSRGARVDITTEEGDTTARITVRHGRDIDVDVTGEDEPTLVRFGEDIVIAEDEDIAGSVVAVGGNVEVLGRVRGNVVAVGGEVRVRPGAYVDGDVVSMGGGIRKAPGGRIEGSDIGMKFLPAGLSWIWGNGGLALPAKILGTAFLVGLLSLFGWLAERLMGERVRRVAGHVQEHLWTSLLAGIAVLLLAGPAMILLCITVVGIPLALLSPVAVLVGLVLGYIVVASVLGQRIVGNDGGDRTEWLRSMLAGLVVFAGILLFGDLLRLGNGMIRGLGLAVKLFGLASALTAATAGLGSVVLSRLGAPRKPIFGAPPPFPGPGPTG